VLQSIDPATGELVASYDEMSDAELASTVDCVHAGWLRWRETDFAERTARMVALADVLAAQRDELSRLMALEMGKPLPEGLAEVDKCIWLCRYTSEHGERQLQSVSVETEAYRSFVSHRPLGVVLAVMPWNFPLWQVYRFAVPALMAGNAGLLKHASNVTGCALAIEQCFLEAGFPPDVFAALRVAGERVSVVLEHPGVAALTFTGSTAAGRLLAEQSGRLLKKTVLELGGSDPYLILHDADVPRAAQACSASRLINAGQSCIAAKRFVVVDAVREEFEQELVAAMGSASFGPLARHDLRDEVHDQVGRSLAAGARLLLGGELPDGPGAFYPATVLTDVSPGMPACDEELFGPVAAVLPVSDEEAAIAAANATPFGLGAAVFTSDIARGERIAETRLDAGSCFVNAFVKSDPRLPFGGIKASGYGRELGELGIKEFVNAKTVWVEPA
jgi:succinate-semialdehyde dehydrogenase/glutarate-semialdehyde dehydrogenase